jgi:hypothetical protein
MTRVLAATCAHFAGVPCAHSHGHAVGGYAATGLGVVIVAVVIIALLRKKGPGPK